MPRFCANLGFLFPEVPFLDRFDAAARAGFTGVEFASPYEYPAAELRARLNANGLTQVLINSPAGNRAAGERGFACLPGRESVFRDGVEQALDYALGLGCKRVHVMAGMPPAGLATDTALALYAANLAWAGERGLAAGVKLVIEPLNPRDAPVAHPGAGRGDRRGDRARPAGAPIRHLPLPDRAGRCDDATRRADACN
jgi:2-dehydrotetronate isomerase